MTAPDSTAPGRTAGQESEFAAVSGAKRFTSDILHPDALHVAFVASTEPHALLREVHTSAASTLPGVEAILTGADIGRRSFGRSVRDYPVLAVDRVLFAGQRIAAIAARDLPTARQAAELVDVDYEPLPPLLDLDDVFSDTDVELHPDGLSYEGANDIHPFGNLQGVEAEIHGDLDAAFATCDRFHEDVFTWDRSHSAPLEPHGCLVHWQADRVDVWSSNKVPNRLRQELADLTGRPAADFVIHPANIGGDFGSKAAPYVEIACCLLSEMTGRPVRTTMTYTEMLTSTAARHAGYVRLKTGMRGDELHAHEVEAVLNGGAFAGVKPRPSRTVSILHHGFAPYDVAVRDERAMTVYSNNVPGGHVRSPGEFQGVFAGESHIDIIARSLGEDPIGFRRRHTSHPGTMRVLEELAEVVDSWRNGTQTDTGIGVSVFSCGAGTGKSTVACEADSTGVTLRVGVPDQGSGMYVSFRRLAAEILGIPVDAITLRAVGADDELPDGGAGSSRVTRIVGNACIDALEHLLDEVGGRPVDPGATGYWIADRLRAIERASVRTTGTSEVSRRAPTDVNPTNGGLAVELSVDTDTGTLQIHRATLVVETGHIVNPVGFRGQLEGGFIYGLGQALFEQLLVEGGQVVTASLGDYKLPCIADVPPLEIRYVHVGPEPDTEIRAVGELSNIGVAPAIANAIEDAVGVRLRELPISAERLWRGLQEQR